MMLPQLVMAVYLPDDAPFVATAHALRVVVAESGIVASTSSLLPKHDVESLKSLTMPAPELVHFHTLYDK